MIFGSLYLAPGSALSALTGGRALPPSSTAALERQYHLNQPFLAQYWYWLANALHGNLGTSIELPRERVHADRRPGLDHAGLVLYASLIICVVGIGLGVAGRRCGPAGWTRAPWSAPPSPPRSRRSSPRSC